MKVFITGVAGFIGSHLAEQLLLQGHHVFGIDNFDPFYPRKTKEKNIIEISKNDKFQFFEADLLDHKNLEEILKQTSCDVVVHLAAKAGVRPSLEDPIAYLRCNTEGTLSLLEAMRKTQMSKIIFASSSSVYGKSPIVPFTEEQKLEHAISPYATSKQAGELYTKLYHNLYQFSVINLRFFTVYGPRQRPDLAIHKFIKANMENKEIPFFGDGSMARDYTYVLDTVAGIEGAIKKIQNEKTLYETYNLGNNQPVTLNELILAIEAATGKACQLKREPTPAGDVPITFANIDRAKRDLGYNPKTQLKQGIDHFYSWLKTQ